MDLDPFFISVERALDPSLRDRAVVIGGNADGTGVVAAASDEARSAGVRPGRTLREAKRLCPDGVFLPGDLEKYARSSEDVTAILLAVSRRVERPSADEAYVDVTPEPGSGATAVARVERLRDDIQRRLALQASFGLASSRLAARVASRRARPRGLLIVLPGYEESFLARQPITALLDLPPHLAEALKESGLASLGDLAAAEPGDLDRIVGEPVAARLQEAARGQGEEPIAVMAPPSWIQEEVTLRSKAADHETVRAILESVTCRALRRLRPFGLAAGALTVEVKRRGGSQRRVTSLEPAVTDDQAACRMALALADPLLDSPSGIVSIQVRLWRLARPGASSLFPGTTDLGPPTALV